MLNASSVILIFFVGVTGGVGACGGPLLFLVMVSASAQLPMDAQVRWTRRRILASGFRGGGWRAVKARPTRVVRPAESKEDYHLDTRNAWWLSVSTTETIGCRVFVSGRKRKAGAWEARRPVCQPQIPIL